MFGLKEWLELKEVNSEVKNKFVFYYSSPSFFSYKEDIIIPFHKKLRSKYGSDLTKINCLGFDATLNFCSQILMGEKMSNGLISNYDFKQLGTGNGFQNKNGYILKFCDFESKKVEWKKK